MKSECRWRKGSDDVQQGARVWVGVMGHRVLAKGETWVWVIKSALLQYCVY
jgi:hypothetical protein